MKANTIDLEGLELSELKDLSLLFLNDDDMDKAIDTQIKKVRAEINELEMLELLGI